MSITILALSSIPALVGCYYIARSQRRKKTQREALVAAAQARASKRKEASAWLDTQPMDSYVDKVETIELSDNFDPHSHLTAEQQDVINLIFGGFPAEIKKDSYRHSGPSAVMAVGQPLRDLPWDSQNRVDKDPWGRK